MVKAITAEWIKIKNSKKLLLSCASPVFFVVLLYLLQTYWVDESSRLTPLHAWGRAGAYGLAVFTTIVRKIWGIVLGFELVHFELIENRSEFFVQRTGRVKMWGSILLVAFCISFSVIVLVGLMPSVISLFISKDVSSTIAITVLLRQCIVVWLITIGSILMGMLFALILKDVIIVICVVLTLEFFPGLYPQTILNLWNRLDGYYYISKLMTPLKNGLSELQNFSFILSEHSLHPGMILWGIILLVYVSSGFALFYRREF